MRAQVPAAPGSAAISLGRFLLTFLVAALAASLAVGTARTLTRFSTGTLPGQYLAASALINGALMLVIAAIGVVPLLGLRHWMLRRRRHFSEPRLMARWMGGVYLAFWGLNTSVGIRVLGQFLEGERSPVLMEVAWWSAGLVLVPALVAVIVSGRRRWRRLATAVASCLLVAAGLKVYSVWASPSRSLPLEMRSSAQRRPHVFVVLVDTLRADHLSTYGYARSTSPAVDSFAEESIVFLRAFAPAPWTRPSCGSLLSSRYPPELGLEGMFSALRREIPILPQLLKVEGYRTAGIVASVHISAQFGFDKGFDLLDSGTTYLRWTGAKPALGRIGLIDYRDVYPRYNAHQLTDRALAWIDEQLADDGSPLFMYLHYSDPHAPYRPPASEDRWREFADEAAGAIDEPPFSPTWGGRQLSPLEIQALIARYDAEIAYFDTHFGRLLQGLKERGIYRESVLVFTADHGEEFLDHGGWTHAHTLYNELLHVPLILKLPARWPRGEGVRSSVVSLVDVVPTIADLLGAAWPRNSFRGRSLLDPDLERSRRPVFARVRRPSLRAVIEGRHKLIQEVLGVDDVVRESYYSLDTNFGERGDGSTGNVGAAAIEALRRAARAIDSLRSDGDPVALDADTLRELKALGYLN